MNTIEKKKTSGFRMWTLIWGLGLAGQICWNMENQWFNTFVYTKIAKDPSIITGMLICSAMATTFATFFFGTWADRTGKRRTFISVGYILWGIFTIGFGLTEFISKDMYLFAAVAVVLADTIMSFFGSMGNDAGFNTWTTDILTDKNRGQIGAALATQPVFGTIIGTVVGGLLVGEDDIHILIDQMQEEVAVFEHHVITCQVDSNFQALLLCRANNVLDNLVILNLEALNIEAVIISKNIGSDILLREFECRTEVGYHCALAIGRDKREATTRAIYAVEYEGLDTQILQGTLVETTCRVNTHLTNQTNACAKLCHSTDGVARRATQREGVGKRGCAILNQSLLLRLHQSHTATTETELGKYIIIFQVDQKICQGISNA